MTILKIVKTALAHLWQGIAVGFALLTLAGRYFVSVYANGDVFGGTWSSGVTLAFTVTPIVTLVVLAVWVFAELRHQRLQAESIARH